MAKLRDLYDAETISRLQNAGKDAPVETEDTPEPAEPPYDPFTDIKEWVPDQPEGTIMFSDAFGWKPRTIPDIPLPSFSDEDWDESARVMIPDVDPDWVWNKQATEALALGLHDGDTVLIWGLQGTGKSCLLEQWCARFRIPFWRQSCNRETREVHFVGNPGLEYDADGHMHIKQEPTLLTDSLRYGGLFCEDEAFRHNSALVLQSLREKTNRTLTLPDAPGKTAEERRLKAPEGRWWYALTDNTSGGGDETGVFDAEVQDASTLDRIDTTIEVDYLSKAQEKRMLKKKVQLNDDILKGMIDVAGEIRKGFRSGTLMCTMSVRGLTSWAHKTERMAHIGKALQVSFLNKVSGDDRKVVEDIFFQVFGRNINANGA